MTLDDVFREVGKLFLETVGLKRDLAELQAKLQAIEPQPEATEAEIPPSAESEG